jgi:hypothetical protein
VLFYFELLVDCGSGSDSGSSGAVRILISSPLAMSSKGWLSLIMYSLYSLKNQEGVLKSWLVFIFF